MGGSAKADPPITVFAVETQFIEPKAAGGAVFEDLPSRVYLQLGDCYGVTSAVTLE